MRIFEHRSDIELKELNTETINGKRHYVTPEGKYPSITSVLSVLSKDSIMAWRKRVGEEEANRISTQAARRGTNVHQMCEDYLNNELDMSKFMPNEKDMFKPLKETLDKHIGTIYAQEAPLYSNYLGIAGRVDCIAEWDGRLSIIDFKTSRKLKKKEWIHSYFQQATAYAIMWEERTGIPIDKIVIAITVDDEDEPQIFVEKRDNWVKDLINTINLYKGQYQ
jgi:genome maintenance exonuclease 1